MTPDFAAIRERAEHYRPRIVRFLRDLIALPSPSGDEERVVGRIREEMEDLGYDRVEFDPLGNVLGYLGSGPRLVALDGHVDTVGVDELPIKLAAHGGGGTDMGAIWQWQEANAPDADCVVILTDAFSPWPEQVSVPSVVLSTTEAKAPEHIAETVFFDPEV